MNGFGFYEQGRIFDTKQVVNNEYQANETYGK